KMSQFPMASKISENYYIVSTSSTRNPVGRWKEHIELVATVAKELSIDFVVSPNADKTKFQKYMGGRINSILTVLAERLKAKSTRVNYEFYPPYKNLISSIHALLDGEPRLGLPKNQVALLNTEEVQDLWRWLIKENPDKKDRELLRKMYTLSRLLAPPARERKVV
ncbi:MAG: hypothetical protein U9Q67_03930, partial [Patescibacteria group bacterium]|nr:hypothetical protein [Patescibacteria group bacterium]